MRSRCRSMSKGYLGKHLVVSRGVYTHHGIGDGKGGVIHYSGLADGLRSGPVERTTLKRFAAGAKVRVRKYHRPYSLALALQRALSRIGENLYSLLGNNCEHFATWCVRRQAV